MRKVGYLAVDDGPKLTLQVLASRLTGTWLGRDESQFSEQLRLAGTGLLICGTSDSPRGRAIEAAARTESNRLGIPLVLLEDFPGNFAPVRGGDPKLLCVESDFAAQLARQKFGRDLSIHTGPAIRYDDMRRNLNALRSLAAVENAVLWIGQPETGDALETLRVLIPALRLQNPVLWFRAHPRDEGFQRGDYQHLVAAARSVEDMTTRSLDELLRRRPRLVVTQFSSVAVEAGFWGIPSLNILLPGIGGARLLEKKGYGVPPWCDIGGSFLVTDPAEMADALDVALNSESARGQVQKRFDEYFKVREEGAPGLINVLYNQGFL